MNVNLLQVTLLTCLGQSTPIHTTVSSQSEHPITETESTKLGVVDCILVQL